MENVGKKSDDWLDKSLKWLFDGPLGDKPGVILAIIIWVIVMSIAMQFLRPFADPTNFPY